MGPSPSPSVSWVVYMSRHHAPLRSSLPPKLPKLYAYAAMLANTNTYTHAVARKRKTQTSCDHSTLLQRTRQRGRRRLIPTRTKLQVAQGLHLDSIQNYTRCTQPSSHHHSTATPSTPTAALRHIGPARPPTHLNRLPLHPNTTTAAATAQPPPAAACVDCMDRRRHSRRSRRSRLRLPH